MLDTAAERSFVDQAEEVIKTARPDSGIDGSTWQQLEVGCTVLARSDVDDGWYEAIITVIDHDHDELTLKWRDYPNEPPVTAKRNRVGLLPAL